MSKRSKARPKKRNLKEKRTTKDVIAELNEDDGRFLVKALAVGFENSTTFIADDESNQLEKLNAAVASGGEPIGFVAIAKTPMQTGHGERIHFCTRPLTEYEKEPWADRYLSQLAEVARGMLEAHIAERSGRLN